MSAFDEVLRSFKERNAQVAPGTVGRDTARQSGGILRQRPNALRSLERKATNPEYQSALAQLPEPVRQALANRDQRRVDSGQMPVPAKDAVKAGVAATTREAVTPAKDRGTSILSIPGNAVKDLGQIVKSLPHLPGALIDEVKDMADGNADDMREQAELGRTGVAAQLSMPGVRMIPGTYVASNIAAGDFGELVEHPLLNLLDILPVAGKVAKGTKVVKAAEAAADVSRATGNYTKPIRPLKVAATRTLNEAGDVVPNRLGQLIDSAWQTKPLAAVSDAFGQQSRAAIRTVSLGEQTIEARLRRPQMDDATGNTFREWAELSDDDTLASRYGGMTREREAQLHELMTTDTRGTAALTGDEAKYVADYRATMDTLAQTQAASGDLVKVNGEWFNRADAGRITRAQERAMAAVGEVFGTGKVTNRRNRKTGEWKQTVHRGVIDDIDALAEVDPRWAEIRGWIDNEDWSSAATAVRELTEAEGFALAARRVNQLKNYGHGAVPLTDQKMFQIRRVINEANIAHRSAEAVRKKINPARFDELITRRAGEQYIAKLMDDSIIADDAAAMRFLREGVLDRIPGFDAREFSKLRDGVRGTWEKLKEAGEDPIYVPRVSPDRARKVGIAKLDGTVPSLQSARARVADISPSVHSPSIAVSHQAFDIIRREVGEQTAREVAAQFGRSEASLYDEFTPAAEAIHALNPAKTLLEIRDELISRQYRPFDPTKLMPFSGKTSGVGAERVWVPRQVAATLEAANGSRMTSLRGLNDPITRMWRISLLPLSPRWHLYNIVGGAGMMSAEVGPQAFRFMGQANEIVRAARAGGDLPRHIPRELERIIGMIGRDEAALALKQGRSLGRWWEQSQAAKLGRKGIQASFDWNSYVDDMYRVMTFLEGESQATRKFAKRGMSEDATKALAAEEAVVLSRKVLQDVAALTPFERSVLRPIFPFYSWLSHLMRFAFNYPADHPWRAAIVAGGSRIVMEDMGDAASTDMLDLIQWGEPDEEGKRKAIRVGGMNPFNDTAKLFTLAGWLGNTNPLFATAAQALGFDAQQGGIDLYPSMSYSAETGGMVVDTGNPVKNLALNSLPHLGALMRYMGQDPEYQKLRMTDPDTADRVLWGGVGLPTAYRRYSRENDYIGAELKRQEDAKTRESDALKAGGDLSGLVDLYGEETVAKLLEARASGQLDDALAFNRDTKG